MIHDVRRSRARDDMRAAGVEALVVTHLPNLRYLTGFSGTAGAAILGAERCVLVVDFRYAAAARELLASRPADGVDLEIVDRGYDEAIVEVLQRRPAAADWDRGGVDVGQPLQPALCRAGVGLVRRLVPTERVIEARRAVKDAFEVATLREAARRLSGMAPGALAFAREGRTEQAVAADIDARDPGRRIRAPGLRNHRGVRPQQRPPARAARRPDAPVGRRGGAGLRGRLRRILRGSYADRASWRSRAGVPADLPRRSGKRTRRRLRRCGRARGRVRSTRRRERCSRVTGLETRSATGRGTASGSKCTKSRGSPSSRGPPGHAGRARAWSSPSSRAPTSTGSAGCGLKTTCWSWTAAARS